jgi:SAM-dependent methyltransferase
MKRCTACGACHPSVQEHCSACGFKPRVLDGFVTHAPHLMHEGGGFEAAYFPVLAQLEAANFWFRARNELILWALQKYCGNFQSYLEIGCGTGYVLSGVAHRFPRAHLTASEIFTTGLQIAAQRVPQAQLLQMDARDIPFRDEFDVVGAFDVVEHIQEDEAVLAQVHAALKPGGHMLLTVPQHQWLWSPSDDYARHERRYTASELHGKVRSAGFTLLRSGSFVSLLLPLMLASRLTSRRKASVFDPLDEFKLPSWLNESLYGLMKAEIGLIKLGINFPAGGSRFLIARKDTAPTAAKNL